MMTELRPLGLEQILKEWPQRAPLQRVGRRELEDRWISVVAAAEALHSKLAGLVDGVEVSSDSTRVHELGGVSQLRTLMETLEGIDRRFGDELAGTLAPLPVRPCRATLSLLADTSPQALLEELAIFAWLGMPSLVRAPRGRWRVPAMFLLELRMLGLGDAISLVTWPHDRSDLLAEAIRRSAVVRVWGRRSTLELVQKAAVGSAATLEFFGPKLSVAVATELTDLALVAEDIVVMEQRGCFSPQHLFFDGELANDPGAALDSLAASLSELQEGSPRPRRAPGEAEIIRAAATRAEFGGGLLRTGAFGDLWYMASPSHLNLGAGCRSLSCSQLPADSRGLEALLSPVSGQLSAVASLAPLHAEMLAVFKRAGAWRFCRLGELQAGRPSAIHEGRCRLGGLLVYERWN